MDYLKLFESEEFKEHLRENVIKYKTVNGIKVVDPEFINSVQSIDPLDIADKFLKNSVNNLSEEKKEDLRGSLGLLNNLLRKSLVDEVTALTYDTTFSSSIKDYLKVVHRLGFKEIYREDHKVVEDQLWESKERAEEKLTEWGADYKILSTSPHHDGKYINIDVEYTEQEMMFWHPEHNVFLHLDTHQGNRNSANIYFNAKMKDQKNAYEFPCSQGFVHFTDVISGDFDAREMLAHNLEKFLSVYEPLDNWYAFDSNLYSYLTHEDFDIGDENWDIAKEKKLKALPKEVLKHIISENIQFDPATRNVCLETFGKIAEQETIDKLKNLSEDAQKDCLIEDFLFDAQHNPEKVITEEVLETVGDNYNKETLPRLVKDTIRNNNLSERDLDESSIIKRISKLTPDELEIVEKENLSKWKIFQKNDLVESLEGRKKELEAKQRPRNRMH